MHIRRTFACTVYNDIKSAVHALKLPHEFCNLRQASCAQSPDDSCRFMSKATPRSMAEDSCNQSAEALQKEVAEILVGTIQDLAVLKFVVRQCHAMLIDHLSGLGFCLHVM